MPTRCKLTLKGLVMCLACAALMGGCNLDDFLEDVDIDIDKDAPLILDDEPVIIEQNVVIEETVIYETREEIVIETIPDVTLLTFENFTGYDIVLSYYVDDFTGEFYEEVLIFDGEVMYLEYPCLFSIQLDWEDDFDFDGFYVGSYDLFDIYLEEGFEYFCGDEIIVTFDEFSVTTTVLPIDL